MTVTHVQEKHRLLRNVVQITDSLISVENLKKKIKVTLCVTLMAKYSVSVTTHASTHTTRFWEKKKSVIVASLLTLNLT